MNRGAPGEAQRPAVSVIVPFHGDERAAARIAAELRSLRLGTGDELIVADNTAAGAFPEKVEPIRVVRAPERRSAYHARNAGAAEATSPWLLFTDADCELPPDLVARFFEPAPDPGCVAVAGEIAGAESQGARLARWARSRRRLIASHHLDSGPAPAGTTANLLVRRDAFAAAGGFDASVRSDADIDLCWRLQANGGGFAYRPQARVGHRDPERLGAVVSQAVGYGAGRRWLRERYGDRVEAPKLAAPLVRAVGGGLVWTLSLRFERALFKLVDGVVALALWWGWRFGDNAAG